jgi:hypothetical protein
MQLINSVIYQYSELILSHSFPDIIDIPFNDSLDNGDRVDAIVIDF